jgi:hypothetical protein
MKKAVFFSLVALISVLACNREERKSSMEGAWRLTYAKSTDTDDAYPTNIKGEQIKMFSKEYFTFCGHFEIDTISQDSYGWGTYTIDGNKYTESVKLHSSKSSIGQSYRMLLEVRNDTLIQTWPTDENWKLQENYSTEKYVRLK